MSGSKPATNSAPPAPPAPAVPVQLLDPGAANALLAGPAVAPPAPSVPGVAVPHPHPGPMEAKREPVGRALSVGSNVSHRSSALRQTVHAVTHDLPSAPGTNLLLDIINLLYGLDLKADRSGHGVYAFKADDASKVKFSSGDYALMRAFFLRVSEVILLPQGLRPKEQELVFEALMKHCLPSGHIFGAAGSSVLLQRAEIVKGYLQRRSFGAEFVGSTEDVENFTFSAGLTFLQEVKAGRLHGVTKKGPFCLERIAGFLLEIEALSRSEAHERVSFDTMAYLYAQLANILQNGPFGVPLDKFPRGDQTLDRVHPMLSSIFETGGRREGEHFVTTGKDGDRLDVSRLSLMRPDVREAASSKYPASAGGFADEKKSARILAGYLTAQSEAYLLMLPEALNAAEDVRVRADTVTSEADRLGALQAGINDRDRRIAELERTQVAVVLPRVRELAIGGSKAVFALQDLLSAMQDCLVKAAAAAPRLHHVNTLENGVFSFLKMPPTAAFAPYLLNSPASMDVVWAGMLGTHLGMAAGGGGGIAQTDFEAAFTTALPLSPSGSQNDVLKKTALSVCLSSTSVTSDIQGLATAIMRHEGYPVSDLSSAVGRSQVRNAPVKLAMITYANSLASWAAFLHDRASKFHLITDEAALGKELKCFSDLAQKLLAKMEGFEKLAVSLNGKPFDLPKVSGGAVSPSETDRVNVGAGGTQTAFINFFNNEVFATKSTVAVPCLPRVEETLTDTVRRVSELVASGDQSLPDFLHSYVPSKVGIAGNVTSDSLWAHLKNVFSNTPAASSLMKVIKDLVLGTLVDVAPPAAASGFGYGGGHPLGPAAAYASDRRSPASTLSGGSGARLRSAHPPVGVPIVRQTTRVLGTRPIGGGGRSTPSDGALSSTGSRPFQARSVAGRRTKQGFESLDGF